MNKEILGILGGMGVYASLEFNKRIFDLTPANKDWEHIHTILDTDTSIPSRTRSILYGEKSPVEGMIKAINCLEKAGAKVVVVPCNSAHYFYDEVSKLININWLNMLSIVADEIKANKCKNTLILGGYITINKKTYDKELNNNTTYFNAEENNLVYQFIESVKLNDVIAMKNLALKLIDIIKRYIKLKNIDSVLYGCTEFSICDIFQKYDEIIIFDSNEIYAQYAVNYMKGKL